MALFLDDLVTRLVAQGVGTYGTNILAGAKAIIPGGDGPYLSLTQTGGNSPTRVHNKTSANTKRPGAAITVRAKTQDTALAMVFAAYAALDGVFNTTLNGTYYQSITAQQEPTDIGLDALKRPMFQFNILAEKNP